MVAGAAAAAARRASALGGGWSRSGQGRTGEGRALRAASREGALLGTSSPGPARARAWSLNPRGRRGAQPCASLPKAHLLLFRGRGKSFWKAKEQKDRGQHGPAAAAGKPSQPPGGAEVGWDRSISMSPAPLGMALRAVGEATKVIPPPTPRDQHRAQQRIPELAFQYVCASGIGVLI